MLMFLIWRYPFSYKYISFYPFKAYPGKKVRKSSPREADVNCSLLSSVAHTMPVHLAVNH